MRRCRAGLLVLLALTASTMQAARRAEVTYLGHSSWIVSVGHVLLLFDYIAESDEAARTLASVLETHRRLPLVVLTTHLHRDHYAPSFLDSIKDRPGTTVLYGWAEESAPAPVVVQPGQTRSIGNGIRITAVESTDAGSAFVVRAGEWTIFHAGDHALWTDQQLAVYESSLRAAKAAAPQLDIAFLPAASGNPTCTQSDSLLRGASIAARLLAPAVVFPMHARCVERRADVFGTLAAVITREHPGVNVVVADRVGFRRSLP